MAKGVQISWGQWSVPQNREKSHCQAQPKEKEVANKTVLVHNPAGLSILVCFCFFCLCFPSACGEKLELLSVLECPTLRARTATVNPASVLFPDTSSWFQSWVSIGPSWTPTFNSFPPECPGPSFSRLHHPLFLFGSALGLGRYR